MIFPTVHSLARTGRRVLLFTHYGQRGEYCYSLTIDRQTHIQDRQDIQDSTYRQTDSYSLFSRRREERDRQTVMIY